MKKKKLEIEGHLLAPVDVFQEQGATLPSGNPPSPSGRSANAPGSGLASDSFIPVETDKERKARRRRELHVQRKRVSILGEDAVVSPVAPSPGIIER